ncbi:DMT family transporter [Spiractinospora alimapuensis]|uniref:DMT family transporter n=1 Tax=Spiractinospora alimapuensis TaxID=2820884 RepID=UPI001F4555CA|nr:DMT family transporter [Spiractinospora alimapuensis]
MLVTAGVLWGTGGPVGHLIQAAGVDAFTVATYRLLSAGLTITGLLLVTGALRRLPRSRALTVRLLVNGVLHALFQLLYFASLALIPVGLATLVKIGSVPVFVSLGVCVLARSRPGVRLLVPVVLAVSGLSLLAGFPSTDADPGQLAAGLACSLGAGLTFSVMTLVNRRPVPGLDPMVNVGLGMLVGAVLLLPAALFVGLAVPLTGAVLGMLAFMALVPTVFAYLTYFRGLRTSSDAATAVAIMAEPLTATVISVAFLGEHIPPLGVLGAALLFVAMAAEPLMRRVPRRS